MNDYKMSLMNQIIKSDDNLSERFNRIWIEILNNSLEFDRKVKLLSELKSIRLNDLKQSFEQIFYKSPKKLSLQMYSGRHSISSELFKNQKYHLNNNIITKVTKNIKELQSFELLKTNKKIKLKKRMFK